jgi:hypothetical protein
MAKLPSCRPYGNDGKIAVISEPPTPQELEFPMPGAYQRIPMPMNLHKGPDWRHDELQHADVVLLTEGDSLRGDFLRRLCADGLGAVEAEQLALCICRGARRNGIAATRRITARLEVITCSRKERLFCYQESQRVYEVSFFKATIGSCQTVEPNPSSPGDTR